MLAPHTYIQYTCLHTIILNVNDTIPDTYVKQPNERCGAAATTCPPPHRHHHQKRRPSAPELSTSVWISKIEQICLFKGSPMIC